MSQINVPMLPSAVLLHTRAMEQLQQQVAQQQAIIRKACAPMLAANAVIKNAINPGIVAINEQCAQITRAHVYLVEQYNKSPKAKAKRAHAALVEVCQTALRKVARRKSLREVAAEFLHQVAQDVRVTMRELLCEFHANAPNGARSFALPHYPLGANTNA